MKKALRFAIPTLLLLACSTLPEGSSIGTEVSVDETIARPVKVRAGDTVKVNLNVNMSSGSSWSLANTTPPNLKFLGTGATPSQTQNNPSGMVGQRETQAFRFKALSKGDVTLEFRKARPWEKQNPEKTFSIQLEVAAK